MLATPQPEPFALELDGRTLAGELGGEGTPIVLCHGLTATRRYVAHGSRVLERSGFRTIAYDARGHGESDPAGDRGGYGYPELADDLEAILDAQAPDRRVILAGHSMGAQTLAALALRRPQRVAAIVAVGPAFDGSRASEAELGGWDRLADGLAKGGVDGFVAAYDHGLDPAWRETLLRITSERLARHRHPEAIVRALREVPRSRPFEDLAELEALELPALVVASHDDSDPGHPYATAASWAEHLPYAKLTSEERGASPLAWQGGRLSRAIAAFCERADVRSRLAS